MVVVGIPSQSNSATATTLDSGDPVTLEATATVPDDSEIQIQVNEYESKSESNPVNSDTVSLDSGESTYELSSLSNSEYYDFTIEFGTNGESPELESLLLIVPEPKNDDSSSDSGDDGQDDEDDEDDGWFDWNPFQSSDNSSWFDFDLDWWPFNQDDGSRSDDDDEEGFFNSDFWLFESTSSDDEGLFSFDFWPFGGDK